MAHAHGHGNGLPRLARARVPRMRDAGAAWRHTPPRHGTPRASRRRAVRPRGNMWLAVHASVHPCAAAPACMARLAACPPVWSCWTAQRSWVGARAQACAHTPQRVGRGVGLFLEGARGACARGTHDAPRVRDRALWRGA
eukprot:5532641-Prymnesium_polylepis.1